MSPLDGTCTHDLQTGRDGITDLNRSHLFPFESENGVGSFIFCLTLFNEPPEFLATTLFSLAHNAFNLKQRDKRARNFVLCIMADGWRQLNPETILLLRKLKLDVSLIDWNKREDVLQDGKGNLLSIVHASCLARDVLTHCSDDPPFDTGRDETLSLEIMLCIKMHNTGKLDSHAWFFRRILPSIKAEFVCQVDAGASLAPDCLGIFERRMRNEPQCVAIVPSLRLKRPERWEGVLYTWQYFNFVVHQSIECYITHSLGYMEALCGQCSLYRYAAIIPPDRSLAEEGILPTYFSGLTPKGLLEHNAFLAEDRMLGGALLLGIFPNATMRYEEEAVVEIDHCISAEELKRQRRRWINSTLASRLYVASHFNGILGADHLSKERKHKAIAASALSIYLMATELISPLFFILTSAVVASELGKKFGNAANPEIGWAGATLCFGMWLLALYQSRPSDDRTRHGKIFPGFLLIAMSINFAATTTIFIAMGPPWLFSIAFTIFFVSWHIFDRAKKGHRLASLCHFALYALSTAGITTYLTSYAHANLSDVSWGTKGLLTSPGSPDNKWSRKRDLFLKGWAATIILILAMILSLPKSYWRVAGECYMASLLMRMVAGMGIAMACRLGRPAHGDAIAH